MTSEFISTKEDVEIQCFLRAIRSITIKFFTPPRTAALRGRRNGESVRPGGTGLRRDSAVLAFRALLRAFASLTSASVRVGVPSLRAPKG